MAALAMIWAGLIGVGFLGALHEYFDAIASFRLHLAGLAILTAIVAALAGAAAPARLSVIAAIVGIASAGPVWDRPEPPQRGREVTLFMANLSDDNDGGDALAPLLVGLDADIVVTLETTAKVRDAVFALDRAYPYRLRRPLERGALRVAIWSHFPLSRTALHLNNTQTPTAASAIVTPPGAYPFGLIGAHLSWPVEGLQERQARALGPMVAELAVPSVVVGDFNAAPWTHAVRLAAAETGMRVAGGLRLTWRGDYPTPFGPVPAPIGQQIDHLLLAREIGLRSIETVPVPGSDHLGLFARITVPEAPPLSGTVPPPYPSP